MMDCQRTDVEFVSDNVICRAWLYRPPASYREPRPGIVMAHGLGGMRDAGLDPYATKFANAGYVVLLFDYRHFGASEGQPRQLLSVKRQLHDWASAIDYMRHLSGVDSNRIALWGTSFSGGHVIVAAARDGKIAAVSAQCPMVDALAASRNFVQYAGICMFFKLIVLGLVDQARAMLRMPPLYIPLIAFPGQVAAMSSHDAASGFAAIAPPDLRNEICSRFALTIAVYRPIAHADKLRCPVLLQVCTNDSLAPPHSAIAAARRIGAKAELKQYECGHFDLYVGKYFEQGSTEQLAFFDRVLSPTGPRSETPPRSR